MSGGTLSGDQGPNASTDQQNNGESDVLVHKHAGLVELTLNRPQRLNSFNESMHIALRTALSTAANDNSCRAILLTGSGRGFCAGQDLSDRDPAKSSSPPDLGHTLTTFYNPLITQIRAIDKPVICAVNGVAAGAGVSLALACDLVFAANTAKFVLSFAKVGLVPDAGASWLLPRLIGEARTKAIAMRATPVSAAQAEQWGMIWQSVEPNELLDVARKEGFALAQGATGGLGLMKQVINQSADNTLEQQLAFEAQQQRQAGRSADYAEGVSAFLEKRQPVFGNSGTGST